MLHCFDELASTNDTALEIAGDGDPLASHGDVVLAYNQTCGRGRLGRDWGQQQGDLAASVILLNLKPEQIALLAMRASLALREVLLEIEGSAEITFKWPNDILLDGKKVAGFLIERDTGANSQDITIVGVGVNVVNIPPVDQQRYAATSLRHALVEAIITSKAFLKSMAARFSEKLQSELLREPAEIKRSWLSHAAYVGQHISFSKLNNGQGEVQGTMLGIDDTGALLLKTGDDDIQRFYAGDICHLRVEM